MWHWCECGSYLQRCTCGVISPQGERPYTSASLSLPVPCHVTPVPSHPEVKGRSSHLVPARRVSGALPPAVVELVVMETWGGGEFVGLTGVELVGIEGLSLWLRVEQITSSDDGGVGR